PAVGDHASYSPSTPSRTPSPAQRRTDGNKVAAPQGGSHPLRSPRKSPDGDHHTVTPTDTRGGRGRTVGSTRAGGAGGHGRSGLATCTARVHRTTHRRRLPTLRAAGSDPVAATVTTCRPRR